MLGRQANEVGDDLGVLPDGETRSDQVFGSSDSKLIEPGYAWVRVSQFQEKSADDLARQITNLFKQGPVKGLVLDLRNDPGGLLEGASGNAVQCMNLMLGFEETTGLVR